MWQSTQQEQGEGVTEVFSPKSNISASQIEAKDGNIQPGTGSISDPFCSLHLRTKDKQFLSSEAVFIFLNLSVTSKAHGGRAQPLLEDAGQLRRFATESDIQPSSQAFIRDVNHSTRLGVQTCCQSQHSCICDTSLAAQRLWRSGNALGFGKLSLAGQDIT